MPSPLPIWVLRAGTLVVAFFLAAISSAQTNQPLSIQKFPAVVPEPREAANMVFDAARGVVLIPGGATSDILFSNAWSFDGYNWEKYVSSVPPRADSTSRWPGDGNALDLQIGNHGTRSNGAAFARGFVSEAFSFPSAQGIAESLHPDEPFSLERVETI